VSFQILPGETAVQAATRTLAEQEAAEARHGKADGLDRKFSEIPQHERIELKQKNPRLYFAAIRAEQGN
jgi:hypothetical protein